MNTNQAKYHIKAFTPMGVFYSRSLTEDDVEDNIREIVNTSDDKAERAETIIGQFHKVKGEYPLCIFGQELVKNSVFMVEECGEEDKDEI